MVARIRGKRLGIVGGLGTETSCKFCLDINNQIRVLTDCQPDIVMENVPVPLELENRMISGEPTSDMFCLLERAVIRLNKAGADFIVIPCNTVHVFIEELRNISKAPIVSIIEETTKACKKFSKVGILGTTTTIKQGLYQRELGRSSIEVLLPADQEAVTRIILNILNNKTNAKDKTKLLQIIQELRNQGAEAAILGCTDLDILVKQADSCLPLIDTTEILKGSVVRILDKK